MIQNGIPLADADYRFPPRELEVVDDSAKSLFVMTSDVERVYEGTRWGEGPVWFGDMHSLIWSDIPNDRVLRWDEKNKRVDVFLQPCGQLNGSARDKNGRYIACENIERRMVRLEYNGRLTVLADEYDGKLLNSPNDVVVASDGAVWFTDPPFGISNWFEGEKQVSEQTARTYRIDPETGVCGAADETVIGPNGLAFSPDEKTLYVVESRAVPNRLIRAFDVADDWTLHNSRVVIDCGPGTSDGIAIDEAGNIWAGWGMGTPELDGVRVFDPQGKLLAIIHLPERCANLCFGGERGNILFMAAQHSLYRTPLNIRGAEWLGL